MRISIFAPLLLAATATALVKPAADKIVIQEDTFSVPGDNPLFFCNNPEDEKYILTVDNVDLDPNPPTAGNNLTITAKGNFKEDIEEGAKVHLQIKYGLITIIRQTADLCDAVKNVDLECPLKKGDMELTKEVALPAQIPPGKYTVLADVYTKDDEKITCLKATVEFHRQSSQKQKVMGFWA